MLEIRVELVQSFQLVAEKMSTLTQKFFFNRERANLAITIPVVSTLRMRKGIRNKTETLVEENSNWRTLVRIPVPVLLIGFCIA